VRYYTTKTSNGNTTFTCTFCEHSVTTLDFNNAIGNRRTQAAAMINQHAASLHVRILSPVKLGGRGAL
jgi:transcription elongation factor Elf1